MSSLFDFNYSVPAAKFDGSDIVPKLDQARLTGQIQRVYELMKDGKWRTLSEIEAAIDEPQASISAQLRNLRKEKFGLHTIKKERRGEASSGNWQYRLIPNTGDGNEAV